MKDLTSEQYEIIGNAALAAWTRHNHEGYLAAGRAAYAASFPHAVAEALEVMNHTSDEEWRSQAHYYQLRGGYLLSFEDVNRFLLNRLARLTAKPDAAVEAVTELLVGARKSGREFSATELVAAVDAARAKEAK